MHRIWMKKPAQWAGELWRESLPMGNGITSAMLCGSVGCEHLWLNRFDRWEGGWESELPDVSDTLEQTRRLLAKERFHEANDLLSKALRERGYRNELATPTAPVEILLRFESEEPFRRYRREICLDTGEARVQFLQGKARMQRRAFVSRADDQLALELTTDGRMTLRLDKPADERLHLALLTDAPNAIADCGDHFYIRNVERLTVLARFDAEPVQGEYEELLARHLPLHRQAMGDAELFLSDEDRPNEAMLDEAMESEAPTELYEKLWRFARYLFVSGTGEAGNPFPLYGLWNGVSKPTWAQNVANENVQMIYWHAPVGGYALLLRPLIHYYFKKMDAFRESARKLFGCRGIYVSTYTTPMNSYPTPNVPVIVNYIGCAGWLCRHFYDYYRFTGDEELLRSEILPFMLETAAFYEDYLTRGADGKIRIEPSVSPENSPGRFMPGDFQEHMGHPNPVVWNSTMDFAILRELLAHLLELSGAVEMDPRRVESWRAILKALPEYMVNSDGAIREWMDEELPDYYRHRHLSHLYPLFPGEEVRRGHPLFDACARAVDLRELGAASGWALAHQSAIYARLGRGERALDCLNTLAKGCLLPNLFTLHNDWRDMGVSLRIDMAPVQLDALMGAANAIQEMLLDVSPGRLALLPACPEKLGCGEIRNWRFPGGRVDMRWNREKRELRAVLKAERPIRLQLVLPEWTGIPAQEIVLRAGEERTI